MGTVRTTASRGAGRASALAPAALFGLFGAAGCVNSVDLAVADARARHLDSREARQPREERVVVRDPDTGVVTEDRQFVFVDGQAVYPQGVQRTWYDGGRPETYRSFDETGEPAGIWWSWWLTGGLRSAYVFRKGEATPMTWWHPNGLVASDGLARAGSRTGRWRFWHDNGELESEGEFVGGKRQGFWTLYDEDGEWRERGVFAAGVREGAWEVR